MTTTTIDPGVMHDWEARKGWKVFVTTIFLGTEHFGTFNIQATDLSHAVWIVRRTLPNACWISSIELSGKVVA